MDVAPGGSSGDGPGMDARITRLEDQFGRIETLLRALDDGVRRLDERVSKLDERVSRLDERVSKLDERVGVLEDRTRHLELDVAEIKGRFHNIPGIWAIATTVVASQVTLAGLLFGVLKLAVVH